MSKVVIVNNIFPPAAGITGESAHELAGFLIRQGIETTVVHTDSSYSGGRKEADVSVKSVKLRSFYNGKNKYLRLFYSFFQSFRLVRKAAGLGVRPIIVMTDPPFLVFWASLFLKKGNWIYWSMDLYPFAFNAAGLVARGNIFYRGFLRIVNQHPPGILLGLGSRQIAFLNNSYGIQLPSIELPCGIWNGSQDGQTPSWRVHDRKIYLGYCGNLGEAHSDSFVTDVIEALDVDKHIMILSIYGAKAPRIKERFHAHPAVIWVDNVPRIHLKYIDVHLVTLLPGWNNICVPSKAFSAICAGSMILFHGDYDNDISGYLASAAALIPCDNHQKERIQAFLQQDNIRDVVMDRKKKAKEIARDLLELKENAFNNVSKSIERNYHG